MSNVSINPTIRIVTCKLHSVAMEVNEDNTVLCGICEENRRLLLVLKDILSGGLVPVSGFLGVIHDYAEVFRKYNP